MPKAVSGGKNLNIKHYVSVKFPERERSNVQFTR